MLRALQRCSAGRGPCPDSGGSDAERRLRRPLEPRRPLAPPRAARARARGARARPTGWGSCGRRGRGTRRACTGARGWSPGAVGRRRAGSSSAGRAPWRAAAAGDGHEGDDGWQDPLPAHACGRPYNDARRARAACATSGGLRRASPGPPRATPRWRRTRAPGTGHRRRAPERARERPRRAAAGARARAAPRPPARATAGRPRADGPGVRARGGRPSAPGGSQSPPKRAPGPPPGEQDTRGDDARTRATLRTVSGSLAGGGARQVAGDAPGPRQARRRRPGTRRSAGSRGVHTVAPELHERLVPVARLARRLRHELLGERPDARLARATTSTSSSTAKRRASTRATLPSTSAARRPNAMLAMAPAV